MILEVTDRHMLRLYRPVDAEELFNLIDSEREYLKEWLPFVNSTKSILDTLTFIEDIYTGKSAEGYAIVYDDKIVGSIGFTVFDKINKRAELGYWLSSKYQGKGLMINSIKTIMDYGFDRLDLNRIQIRAAVDNYKSRRLPEKLGFTMEGVEREGERYDDENYFDIVVYSFLKKDRM